MGPQTTFGVPQVACLPSQDLHLSAARHLLAQIYECFDDEKSPGKRGISEKYTKIAKMFNTNIQDVWRCPRWFFFPGLTFWRDNSQSNKWFLKQMEIRLMIGFGQGPRQQSCVMNVLFCSSCGWGILGMASTSENLTRKKKLGPWPKDA